MIPSRTSEAFSFSPYCVAICTAPCSINTMPKETLWGDNPFGYENSLNAHVRRVREKIETDPSKPVSLITIKGLGYKLIARK